MKVLKCDLMGCHFVDVSLEQVTSLTHGMRLSSMCHLCGPHPWNLRTGLEGIWIPSGCKVKDFKVPVPGHYVILGDPGR